MTRRLSPLLLLLLLAAGARAEGGVLPDPRLVPPAERLGALLERVRLEHGKLSTLEAEFVQRKESSLLLEPSESHGVFSYQAPDRVRWEYLEPEPITLVIAGEEMTTWYRDLGQAERANVGRHSQRILEYLGAGTSVDTLTRYFVAKLAISQVGEPFRLELTPRFERVARRLQQMTLWIDAESFLPVGLLYVEGDGDLTEYRFKNLQVNRSLPASRFEIALPHDVDVREIDLEDRASMR